MLLALSPRGYFIALNSRVFTDGAASASSASSCVVTALERIMSSASKTNPVYPPAISKPPLADTYVRWYEKSP